MTRRSSNKLNSFVIRNQIVASFAIAVLISSSRLMTEGTFAADNVEVSLADLVSDDVGVCVEARDLRQYATDILFGREAERWKRLAILQDWRDSDEFKRLMQARDSLQQVLNQAPEAWAARLFGKSIAFAVYPRAEREPAMILLIEAEDAEVVETTIQTWNRVEQQQTKSLTFNDRQYFLRTRLRDGKPAGPRLYYWRDGKRLAVTEEEELIHRVIQLAERKTPTAVNRAGKTTDSKTITDTVDRTNALTPLSQSETYLRAKKSLTGDSFLTIFINPDECRKNKSDAADETNNPWRNLERRMISVIVGAHWDRGLIVETVLHHRAAEEADEFWFPLTNQAGPSDDGVGLGIPSNLLLLITGRRELSLLINELSDFAEKRHPRDFHGFRAGLKSLLLNRDFFDDLLPLVTSRWSIAIVSTSDTHSSGKSGGHFPFHGMMKIEFRDDAKPAKQTVETSNAPVDESSTEKLPPLRKSLHNFWLTVFNVLTGIHNAGHPDQTIVLRTDESSLVSKLWIENVPQFEPTVTIEEHRMILSSIGELANVADWPNSSNREKNQAGHDWAYWMEKYSPTPDVLMLLHVARFRETLSAHREQLLQLAYSRLSEQPGSLEKRMDGLIDLLQASDGIIMSVDWGATESRLLYGSLFFSDPADVHASPEN